MDLNELYKEIEKAEVDLNAKRLKYIKEALVENEELEKEGNPFSKMMLIGVSSVDRLSDCYVYYGLWASESKIEEMIADYKGRIYEYYEFKEEVINKIRQLYT